MKTEETALAVAAGRRLLFSPAWAEGAVVFDARSGDFWVVSQEVRSALAALADRDAASAPGQEPSPEIIESLRAHGIIRAS